MIPAFMDGLGVGPWDRRIHSEISFEVVSECVIHVDAPPVTRAARP